MEDTQNESATVTKDNKDNHESMINEIRKTVVVLQEKNEEEINRNKPWRIVIRRNIVTGGGSDENIFRSKEDN